MVIVEPEATFSACFGPAFLVCHPSVYAELLAKKMKQHNSKVWLVNTGWTGGSFGVGKRLSLKDTRAILNAIHSGELAKQATAVDETFGFAVPPACPDVSAQIPNPQAAWSDKGAYEAAAKKLASLFIQNFEKFADGVSAETKKAGPVVR